MHHRIGLILLCTLTAACTQSKTPVVEERAAVPEGINDRFLDPNLDAEAWVKRWEVESREIYAARHEVVAALNLKPGDRIADVGAGTGLFMAPFSEAVGPRGKVYEVDISPRFIDHIRKRAEDEKLSNVQAVLSKEDSTELPADSVDTVFTSDTYHHFEYYKAMLASIRQALRPGGQFIIVDFERIPGTSRPWILNHVRAGKEQVTGEVEQAGFKLVEEVKIPGFHDNYFLRFRRP